MRAQNFRNLTPDRRKTDGRQARRFGPGAEQPTAALSDRRELVLTERVGNSIILVTYFD